MPGETLAADAVANALAPVVRAAPRPGRIAVAMSGGVDSAVALHRAGEGRGRCDAPSLARPGGAYRGARLLLTRRRHPRARDLSRARPSACDTGPARGVQAHRRAGVRGRLRGRPDAEPVHAMQRSVPIRCSDRVRGADRRRRPLDGPLRACRPAQRNASRRARRRRLRRTSPTCSRRSIPPSSTASRSRSAVKRRPSVRREAEGAGLAAARRPESQEACFLAGGDYRSFLTRNGLESSPGDIVDEAGTVLGRHEGLWRFTPGQRRGVGVVSREPLHVLRSDRESNTLVVGPRSALGARHVAASGRLYDSVARGRCEASLPVSGGRGGGDAHRGRIRRSSSESRSTQSLRARWPCSTTVTSSWEQA